MFQWYQKLPLNINPVAFSIGPVGIHWYALMYLVGFLVVYLLLARELAKSQKRKNQLTEGISKEIIIDFIFYSILGLIIGARLGYALIYNFQYFWENPLSIILPFDISGGTYTGISGMSYFGGLIGVIMAGAVYLKKKKIDIWQFSEFLVPAVPAGYFFGRIGNFLNGELFGRETGAVWGMYFPSGGSEILRHPSQLYEALLEGLLLFVILQVMKRKSPFPGFLLLIYLSGYGFFRFIVEFFREPDNDAVMIFNTLTINQLFSLFLMFSTLTLGLYLRKKRCYNLSNN